jgi:hypothetical protein
MLVEVSWGKNIQDMMQKVYLNLISCMDLFINKKYYSDTMLHALCTLFHAHKAAIAWL